MARIFVGNSEFQTLRGKPQYSEYRAGLQLLAVLAIVNPQLPANERITVNEATRPRASQQAFWNDYQRRGAPPAVVAARPFTSKHDGGGNDESRAFDLGGPGGSVITNRAHALFKATALAYGIHHTGAGFRPVEKWHFEYVPGTATKLASEGPTHQEKQEALMTARLYRHPNGTIAGIDPTTGWYWPCPNPDYVVLLRALKVVVDVDPIQLPANQYDFMVNLVILNRQEVANTVWATPLNGWNGAAPAHQRLVGADRGGVAPEYVDQIATAVQKKLPVGSGGTIDTDSLAAKVVAGVKALFTKAGS